MTVVQDSYACSDFPVCNELIFPLADQWCMFFFFFHLKCCEIELHWYTSMLLFATPVKGKKKWVLYCHWHELWCHRDCLIFELVWVYHVIMKRASQELENSRRIFPPFWRWTPWMGVEPTDTYLLQGQASRFPWGWLKIPNSLKCPHCNLWTMGGKVHSKSSATKATHQNTIMTLDDLTLKCMKDEFKAFVMCFF